MDYETRDKIDFAVQLYLSQVSNDVKLVFSMDKTGPESVQQLEMPAQLSGVLEYDGWGDDESKVYRHHVLPHYTWYRIRELVNDAINHTGDFHHIFLERIYPQEDGTITLYMGS